MENTGLQASRSPLSLLEAHLLLNSRRRQSCEWPVGRVTHALVRLMTAPREACSARRRGLGLLSDA